LRIPNVAPGRRIKCPRCGDVFAAPTPPRDENLPVVEPIEEPADSPVPAKTLPTPEEPVEVLSLADDEPAPAPKKEKKSVGITGAPRTSDGEPAKVKPAAAPRKPKPAKNRPGKTRAAAAWDEEDRPTRSAINPFVLIGVLTVLAASVVAVGVFVVIRQSDRRAEQVARAEEAAAAEQREADLRLKREAERALVQPKLELPRPPVGQPDPVRPEPFRPEPFRPEPFNADLPEIAPPPPVAPPVAPPVRPPVVPPFDPPVRPPKRKGDEAPDKAAVVFPPAQPVVIKPAPLAEDRVELKLPGVVSDACVGGGGRYWCLLLAEEKQVAVFDVNAGKIAKYLPVAGGKMLLAASMNKLIVAYPDTGAMTRFDLATLEKEVTVQSPVERIHALVMGSASAGPLVAVHTGGTSSIDLTTFKAVDATPAMAGMFRNDLGRHYRVSPDGHVIGSWSSRVSPSGLYVNPLGETAVKAFSEHKTVGFVLPSADGTTVTAAGVFDPTGKPLAGPEGYFFRAPALEGKFYLTIPGGGGAQHNTGRSDVNKPTVLYSTGEARALITLPNVELPAGNEAWAATDFLGDKKVLFTTAGQLIAVIDKTNDKLVLHKFDLLAALDRAGVDYLLVTSRPPAARPGAPFKYAPEVKSKRGGVAMKLDAGPAGMKVDPDGSVTWDVPKDWNGTESVILTITDKSGQEIFHTFTLTPAPAANGGVAVADPPRPEPRPEPVPPAPVGGDRPGVRPAAAPVKITPTKAADKAEIKLPGTVDLTCFGCNGRFVLLRIPSQKQIAVLDVCEGKVAKYIPIPEDSALMAAGNEHLFVLNPTANVIQRWDLTTLEKELTVANPLTGAPRQLLMGHASNGPLFVVGPNKALDPKTLKEIDLGKGAGGRGMGDMAGHPSYPPAVRISADGRVFAWFSQGTSPSGLSSMVLGGDEAKCHYAHVTVGAIIPGPDGTLFTAGGLFTPELKALDGANANRYQYWHHAPIPAAHGKLYLSIAPDELPNGINKKGGPKVTLKLVGENRPLVELGELAGFDIPKNHNQTGARGLQLHDRVFMVPDAKAMAVLHATADKVTIHALDVDALMDKAGIDYLYVTSKPPGAVCGMLFSYKPEVKSRKGGVKLKLDAGPDGMKVAADGTVTWDVPENFADTSVSVILTVSDKTGQEVFHTFTLPVATRPR
jgi:hypothetical protein